MRILKLLGYKTAFIVLSMLEWVGRLTVLMLLLGSMVYGSIVGYELWFSDTAKWVRVHQIYNNLITYSGQAQNRTPLLIWRNPVENALANNVQIAITSGLVDKAESWDEVAFVLGHELAHQNLGHLTNFKQSTPSDTAILEANADKLGAVYMMKAGFDICKGREIFKRWKKNNGNSLGTTHPPYSYRYDELNIGCE